MPKAARLALSVQASPAPPDGRNAPCGHYRRYGLVSSMVSGCFVPFAGPLGGRGMILTLSLQGNMRGGQAARRRLMMRPMGKGVSKRLFRAAVTALVALGLAVSAWADSYPHSSRVERIEQLTHDVKRITFPAPGQFRMFSFHAPSKTMFGPWLTTLQPGNVLEGQVGGMNWKKREFG